MRCFEIVPVPMQNFWRTQERRRRGCFSAFFEEELLCRRETQGLTYIREFPESRYLMVRFNPAQSSNISRYFLLLQCFMTSK
ncbi:hypothetical protein, partial [Desulfovibrio sp. An276]|uniref:hypothetical protein n=1 Tax=Desulfovibrio sp. An276 TaxID=1965618 RepID=UPI00194E529F